ncbi:hypothetical protein Tco_1409069 [Tanacetum coccineum]
MTQHVIPAAQLVPKYHSIRRCNNYVVLQSIPCSPECKIVGHILLDHPPSYALTATADVPAVYLQQFWRTVSKVPGPEETIKFMLNTQEFVYNVDIFRDILYFLVETPDNPFVAPVNIKTIEAFMNKVGYQCVVDKVSVFYTKNLAQPWQTMFKVFNRCFTTRTSGHDQTKINILQMFHAVINRTNVDYAALLWWDFMNNVKQKKEAIQYPRFNKLIIADLMKKFPEIPQSIEEDYHSIKDDIPLVSVYTTGDIHVQGMLISDEFLTKEIYATTDFKEYERVFMNIDVPMNQPQLIGRKRKQSAGESSSLQKSLRITIRQQKVVERDHDDDDSKDRLEPESHKDNLEHVDDDNDKDDEKVEDEEGGEMDSSETRNEETHITIPTPPRSPRTILSSDKNITHELTDIVPLLTTTTSQTSHSKRGISNKYSHLQAKQFWKTHKQVNQVLHQGVSQLVEKAIEDLIESNLKPCIAATIIENRNAFRLEVPDLVSQEFNAQAPTIIEELFKHYMKRSLQDQANDPALWEVMKCKFEKSSFFKTSCRDDDIHSHHDDHQEDDASPEGEKRQQQQQEWDAWVEETVIDEDEVISEDETPELITELQDVDKHVPTIYDYERMRDTLNDALNNQFKNAEEITEVVRITTDQPHGLDFMEQILVMRENDKLDSFFEADFKYLNKNNIEDLYYLCRNKKVNYRETNYQIKVNLTAPTLTFLDIEACGPHLIVDKLDTGLIYLNNKGEKRLMFLVEIVKFCDATLEMVLNEVNLKIFQSEPWKKSPLLGELYRDIMKAFEREITKHLNHREQIRRWEYFVVRAFSGDVYLGDHVGYPFRPDSELYESLRPYQRLKKTHYEEVLRKSDQMHQNFEKSSIAMTHKLDDMIELPKSQPKKTYMKDLECGMVRVKIPRYREYNLAHLKLVFEFSIYKVWKSVRYGVSKSWIRRIGDFLEHGYAVSSLMDTVYWSSE